MSLRSDWRERRRKSTVWRGLRARLPLAGAALVGYALVWVPLERSGVPLVLAAAIAGIAATVLVTPYERIAKAPDTPSYEVARAIRPWWLANFCTVTVVTAQLLAHHSGFDPLFGHFWLWLTTSAFVTWTGNFQLATERRDEMFDRVLRAEEPEHAMELANLCWLILEEDETISPERRIAVRVTLAGALITLSSRSDQEDLLPEALDVLRDALDAAPPELALAAMEQLTEAMRVKAERTGDEVGWDEALAAFGEVAERAAEIVPGADAAWRAAYATRFEYEAVHARDPAEATELQAAARAVLADAVQGTPRHSDERTLRSARLARLDAEFHPLHTDLDDAIRTCARAVRRLRWVDSERCAEARIALIDLRVLRARLAPAGPVGRLMDRVWPDHPTDGVTGAIWSGRAKDDLMRATWTCMAAMAKGDPSGEAARRMPMLRLRLTEHLQLPTPHRMLGLTGGMFARVMTAQGGQSHTRSAQVALEWAQWAQQHGDDAGAAEAWWCWVNAVSADLRRRVLHDKEHRISAFQALFVEAAARLLRADRARDAAVTLDLGRAMLLTERMNRDRDDLERRLIAAGEHELAEHWREAGELIELTDRAAFGGAEGLPDVVPSDRGASLASTEYMALSTHEALLREISHLDGFEDVDAAPDYELLRDAASAGPLVYLAPQKEGGLALVVSVEALEPVAVALPRLTPAMVTQHVQALRDAEREDDQREGGGTDATDALLATLLPTLADDVLAPLTAVLPEGPALVTLIPVGATAELPLHAAAPEAWPHVLRYAPNARILLRARTTADRLIGAPLQVLTVGVRDAPDCEPLENAPVESEGVAELFGSLAERPEPADVEAVRELLDECEVWHFACHGVHRPLAPLDSTLELADGRLTARELFARLTSPRRLAVLSACRTARIADDLPDELVGFPSALLQAGVAGVVSCQAKVQDDAATLLVLAFFERFDSLSPPAYALAEAQAWLRSATNREITGAFPDVLTEPYQELAEDLERWLEHRPFSRPGSWSLFNYTGA